MKAELLEWPDSWLDLPDNFLTNAELALFLKMSSVQVGAMLLPGVKSESESGK